MPEKVLGNFSANFGKRWTTSVKKIVIKKLILTNIKLLKIRLKVTK